MDNEGEWSGLLLVGSDAQSNHEVRTRLGELCGQKLGARDAEPTPVLQLQTKYYTAPVELHAQHVQLNALADGSKPLPHPLHEFEAIICVVDADSEESFLHVHKYVQDLLEEHPAFDVCLMVSLPSTAAGNKSAAYHQRLEQWCQDNEFELVDTLDTGENQAAEAGIETRGMERVLEALHCQMWRSMVMGGPASISSTQADNDAIAAVEIVAVGHTAAAVVEEPVAAEASSPAPEEDRLESLFRGLKMAGPSAGGMDNDAEMDLHAFSSLIDEVRRVRENGQSLTDEERRQQAAAVAMRLWNLLGSDDEEDDSDEEK